MNRRDTGEPRSVKKCDEFVGRSTIYITPCERTQQEPIVRRFRNGGKNRNHGNDDRDDRDDGRDIRDQANTADRPRAGNGVSRLCRPVAARSTIHT